MNIFLKKQSQSRDHIDDIIMTYIIFAATENNFRFPGKLASGELKF